MAAKGSVMEADVMKVDVMKVDVPASTYRVQLHAGFGFRDLAAQVPYLASLGITHIYLSPILQAAPGSMHGYDVVDHTKLSDDLGGEEAFAELRAALDGAGLRAVLDIVPNHMALPTPARLNAPWHDLLRHGRDSAYADWFDVDWEASPQVVVPVLGSHLADCVAGGEVRLDRDDAGQPVIRYYDHEFPVRAGTTYDQAASVPLPELLAAQHYRLAFWRTGNEELNYRRFFDVTTLAGVRVELPEVFDATHERIRELVASGTVTGLRVDHPDGLADPGGYVATLRDKTGVPWLVVEKILEGDEELPADWPCEGTTGYDAIARIGGLFVDADGLDELTRLYVSLTAEPADFDTVVLQAKQEALTRLLPAEVDRLTETLVRICRAEPLLGDHSRAALRETLTELLRSFPVYRAYVRPGEEPPAESVHLIDKAVEQAAGRLPQYRTDTLHLVRDLALGRHGRSSDKDDFLLRFQQTCGPAMAKGVEDTSFYRWFRLASANEVGGDPAHPAVSPEQFAAWAAEQQAKRPASMTTLSTHDTKRAEDVRARLAVLSEVPHEWAGAVRRWRELSASYRPQQLDGNTEYLLWQTLVGAWPISEERLTAYLEKATREAKRHTTWTEPNEAYDVALAQLARAVLEDEAIVDAVQQFVDRIGVGTRANVLGQKLLQLLSPGVPDVYQGTELLALSLVDPDNRRAVDYDERRALLQGLDAGKPVDGLDAEKLRVVSAALRLRRDMPEVVGPAGTWSRLACDNEHAFGWAWSGSESGSESDWESAEVVAVVTRLAHRLADKGGWGDVALSLPEGQWTDVLTGHTRHGGVVRVGALLAELPVSLLRRY